MSRHYKMKKHQPELRLGLIQSFKEKRETILKLGRVWVKEGETWVRSNNPKTVWVAAQFIEAEIMRLESKGNSQPI
jgi:hypothetical protein